MHDSSDTDYTGDSGQTHDVDYSDPTVGNHSIDLTVDPDGTTHIEIGLDHGSSDQIDFTDPTQPSPAQSGPAATPTDYTPSSNTELDPSEIDPDLLPEHGGADPSVAGDPGSASFVEPVPSISDPTSTTPDYATPTSTSPASTHPASTTPVSTEPDPVLDPTPGSSHVSIEVGPDGGVHIDIDGAAPTTGPDAIPHLTPVDPTESPSSPFTDPKSPSDTPPVAPQSVPGVPDLDLPDLPHIPGHPDPTDPTDPATPATPTDPAEPAKPATPATPEGPAHAPDDGVDGNAAAWHGDWFYQVTDGACGPSSVAQVVSEFTGMHIQDPTVMVNRAQELGLYPSGNPEDGMTTQGIVTLMNDGGVPCHSEHSSMADLQDKLESGYGVIATVDSGVIWGQDAPTDAPQADHAVVVSEVDTVKGTVTLSDPGNPDGNGETITIEQFEKAWSGSEDEMIVSDHTDPDLADHAGVDPAVAAKAPWAMIDLTSR